MLFTQCILGSSSPQCVRSVAIAGYRSKGWVGVPWDGKGIQRSRPVHARHKDNRDLAQVAGPATRTTTTDRLWPVAGARRQAPGGQPRPPAPREQTAHASRRPSPPGLRPGMACRIRMQRQTASKAHRLTAGLLRAVLMHACTHARRGAETQSASAICQRR
jgi:hypothetical protein